MFGDSPTTRVTITSEDIFPKYSYGCIDLDIFLERPLNMFINNLLEHRVDIIINILFECICCDASSIRSSEVLPIYHYYQYIINACGEPP